MRRLRLFGLFITLVCVMGIAAASASALENPEILSTVPATFTATSGSGVLELVNAKSKIPCSADTLKGEFTSIRLGTVAIDFKECKSNGLECHTSGDAAEVILIAGAGIHLAANEIEKALTLLLVVTLNNIVTVLCGGESVTITITGAVVGVVSGIKSGTATTTATVTFTQSAGVQNVTTCIFDKVFCAKGPFSLSANFGKKAETAGLSTTESVTFAKAATVDF